ncbi:MAG: hypothetical protein Q9160_003938 [Pyrenula sp. 1 TL-2023]
MPPPESVCTTCIKSQSTLPHNLKNCAKRHSSLYCSRECQKADWKTHKKTCGATSSPAATTSSQQHAPNPSSPSFNPDQLLQGLSSSENKPSSTLLHNQPEPAVFALLIDSYRLRVDDEYAYEGEVDEDSLYGAGDVAAARRGFSRFLDRFERRNAKTGILPSWWSKAKRSEGEKVAANGKRANWSYVGNAVEKSDVVERYGNPLMPMQLRMLAEEGLGRGLRMGMGMGGLRRREDGSPIPPWEKTDEDEDEDEEFMVE